MSELRPAEVLAQVSKALPPASRRHIVIIGSLAAGHAFFADDGTKAVRTKDVDCILEPFETAASTAQDITRALLDAGWQRRVTGDHTTPGSAATPDSELPAVRLYPPHTDIHSADAWFIELLTVPESEHLAMRSWTRVTLKEGDFGLPSFRYLSIVAFQAPFIEGLELRCARTEMMALANLLEHSTIKPELITGTRLKRSNKDLGRVLAIAVLSELDDFRQWIERWLAALRSCFPSEWAAAGIELGNGLRELLASESDFEQAYDSCINGLLASIGTSQVEFRTTAERLIADAIAPVEAIARDSGVTT